MQGEVFYTVEEAARALKLTPDRIRQMLRDGEIEGVPPSCGGTSDWKLPIRVIHGRDRPPPIDRSESPTTGPESLSASEGSLVVRTSAGRESRIQYTHNRSATTRQRIAADLPRHPPTVLTARAPDSKRRMPRRGWKLVAVKCPGHHAGAFSPLKISRANRCFSQ
jgi:excisionase family DNA binding protein